MSSHLSLAPARAAHVRASGVHVSFGGRPVLAGVDLVAAAGDRVAVVGENGRGKTTLLRVLAGDLPTDRGEVHRAGSVGVADQQLPLGATDTHRPVAELSVGARRRLDLALVLAGRPHVLLLDEPTNHLSATLVDELTAALDATPAAVVVATHDRQLLRDTAEWPRLEL
jgi:macrolide transport system ATP-binding/permease protein